MAQGEELINAIRRANEGITDPFLTLKMDKVEELCVQIFHTVAESPEKAPQIRKFMNYYLPATRKLVENYLTMLNRGVSEEQMYNARATAIRGLDMIITAAQKQLDNLYKSNMLDVETDIDVLEQMLKRDGYTDMAFEHVSKVPANQNTYTATAAQMQQHAAPTLPFDEDTGVLDYNAASHQQQES